MEPIQKTVASKDGTTIAFEQSGSGPAILLVDAATADRNASTALGKLLSPAFTVINYDRRGRGRSTDTQPYAVQREVQDIEAIIDAVGAPAYLFGYSSGAVLALEAANQLGKKVKGLFMYEPPFIIDGSRPPLPADYVQHLNDLLAQGRREDMVTYFMEDAMGIPSDMLAGMRQSPMWPGLVALAHTLPYDGLITAEYLSGKPLPADRWTNVQAPVMVLVGGASPAFFHDGARALTGLLTNAHYSTLPGRDHGAVSMAPDEVAAAIETFFTL